MSGMRIRLLVAALFATLASSSAGAQQHIRFNITMPVGKVSPMHMRVSQYLPDTKIYERWWHEIAECQALPLPPQHTRIEWVHVNAIHFYDADRDHPDSTGRIAWDIGKSYIPTGVIMIALPYKYDEEVIKHEMTHWLIFWSGAKNKEDHPALFFSGRCGVWETYHGPG
jgi:hypothetical protein